MPFNSDWDEPIGNAAASLGQERPHLQLPQRLRLDLPDTLARHAELLPRLFQRVVGVMPMPKRSTRSSRGVPQPLPRPGGEVERCARAELPVAPWGFAYSASIM